MNPSFLRSHDYAFLIRRWRKVARAAGLKMTRFSEASGYDMFVLTSRKSPNGGVYLSAGIHGDEPGATEGLLHWAETNTKTLRQLPCVIFPCLNPWGLVNNCRLDEYENDLNRVFQHDEVPFVAELKQIIKPYRFALSLTLHEDYDGQGFYLYEVQQNKPYWAEELLEVVKPILPLESRKAVDGRKMRRPGLIRPKIDMREVVLIPEALYLHANHCNRSFTFETPSEFGIDQRIAVHVALIEECVRRVLASHP